MKKNYTSVLTACLFALAVNSAFAQSPTITSANLPAVGVTFNEMSDSTAADLANLTVTAGSSSAQSWNYAGKFANVYSAPISFVSASTGLGASNFPGANLAAASGGNWEYFTSSSSGLSLDGFYANYGAGVGYIAVPYTPSEMIVPTPFTYGNTSVSNFSSTSTFTVSNAGTTYTVTNRQHSTRTITADAYGSLTTPTGTYPSTLRTKAYELQIDTEFVYSGSVLVNTSPSRDSSLSYEWLQNSQSLLLMEIDMNGAGTAVNGASYLASVTTGIVSIPSPFAELSVYPNPATVATNISYQNKNATQVTIQLFDISGRLITTLANENQTTGQQIVPVDTKALGLTSGLYFVRVTSPNGSETLKLTVN